MIVVILRWELQNGERIKNSSVDVVAFFSVLSLVCVGDEVFSSFGLEDHGILSLC
jgi:hypothetical protein